MENAWRQFETSHEPEGLGSVAASLEARDFARGFLWTKSGHRQITTITIVTCSDSGTSQSICCNRRRRDFENAQSLTRPQVPIDASTPKHRDLHSLENSEMNQRSCINDP